MVSQHKKSYYYYLKKNFCIPKIDNIYKIQSNLYKLHNFCDSPVKKMICVDKKTTNLDRKPKLIVPERLQLFSL